MGSSPIRNIMKLTLEEKIRYYGPWVKDLPEETEFIIWHLVFNEAVLKHSPKELEDYEDWYPDQDMGYLRFPNGWKVDVGIYGSIKNDEFVLDDHYTLYVFPPGIDWENCGYPTDDKYIEEYIIGQNVLNRILEISKL